ncbi:MAG: hypothetical protein ACXAE3_16375, partial [Candidatus Kariarchaeaceae archaeon]
MATQSLPELGVQRVTDFFKSASRNMLLTIWSIRVIALLMLALLVNTVLSIMTAEVGDVSNLEALFTFVVLFVFVIALAILTIVSFITFTILPSEFTFEYTFAVRAFIVNQVFGNIRILDFMDEEQFLGNTADPFAPLAYLLNKPQKEIYNPILMKGLILAGIVLIVLTGIGFIRRSDVKLAGVTLVISQIVILLAYLKDYTLVLNLDNTSISTLLNSNLYRLALISYLYFEFSLQTGYLYSLTSPTLTRQRRVGKSLQRLSEFRLGITKLGTEEEKESDTAKKEMTDETDEGREKVSSAMAMGSGSTSAKKYSADALIFLMDSAQDSLFSKPGGDQERLTGRLQRYHDGLLQHDPKLDDKLGGSAEKAFKPLMVLITVIGSLVTRLAIIIFLSWLVVKPQVLLEFISLPESITNSLEITQPEGLLIVLIPVVFL